MKRPVASCPYCCAQVFSARVDFASGLAQCEHCREAFDVDDSLVARHDVLDALAVPVGWSAERVESGTDTGSYRAARSKWSRQVRIRWRWASPRLRNQALLGIAGLIALFIAASYALFIDSVPGPAQAGALPWLGTAALGAGLSSLLIQSMAPTTLSVVNGSVRIAQFPRLLRHVELPSGSVQRLYCRRGKNSQGDVSYSVVAWTGDREVWLASDFEHKRHAQFLERELRWALTRT